MCKKALLFLVSFTLLCSSVQIATCAYKPSPYLVADCHQADIPSQTAYVDLLLPLQENDDLFVTQKDETEIYLFTDRTAFEIDPASEIATYNDGYYSYLFHFNGSTITINTNAYSGEISIQYGAQQELLQYIEKMHSCKLAFVDAQGGILEISDAFTVRDRLFRDFRKLLISGKSVSVEYVINLYQSVFSVIIFLVTAGMCLAIFLRLKKIHFRRKTQNPAKWKREHS